MMLHQDGSNHEWVPGKKWDLIVTMDDATSEHYSMFFVLEEGTDSSFQGVKDVIKKKGMFSALYTDRGSHYWFTPKAGGRVSKRQLTQFGRAMRQFRDTGDPCLFPGSTWAKRANVPHPPGPSTQGSVPDFSMSRGPP